MDILAPDRRSALMSRIRSKNTRPELTTRRVAHRLGFRFRLHRHDLPGKPDLVFPKLRKVVFVHGCYWHRHPNCQQAYFPKSNTAFWQTKFDTNVARDRAATAELLKLGWEVLVIWECETESEDGLARRLATYLKEEKSSEMKTNVAL